MGDPHRPWIYLLMACLLILTAVLTGFERALQSLDKASLEKEEQSGEGSETVEILLHILRNPKRFYCVRQTVSVSLGFVLCLILPMFDFKWLWQEILAVLGLMIFFYMFCILLPAHLKIRDARQRAEFLMGPVRLLMTAAAPATLLTDRIVHLLLRLVGITPDEDEDNVTEEEIISMVTEGHEQGVIEASEAEMITNIFEYGDKEAGEIMTHRTAIVALNGDWSLEEAVDFMMEQNVSRFPVYQNDNIDDIIGILNLKDAMYHCRTGKEQAVPVRDIEGLLRKAWFIPETRKINELLKRMQSEKIQLVIVVDEYGQVAGLISMEDILEEIVGNIQDEYDTDEDFIVAEADGSLTLDGLTPLEELEDALGLSFEEEEFGTLNGLLISLLGRIPSEDERPVIWYKGYEFSVLEMVNKTIETVRGVKKEEPSGEEEQETADEKSVEAQ